MHPVVLVEIGIAALVLMWRGAQIAALFRQLVEELNNWRGGPPPTHPLPGDDGVILLRSRPKIDLFR